MLTDHKEHLDEVMGTLKEWNQEGCEGSSKAHERLNCARPEGNPDLANEAIKQQRLAWDASLTAYEAAKALSKAVTAQIEWEKSKDDN